MAFTRKNKGKLQLDQAHSMDDIRLVLLEAYGRLNTLQAVAKEFGTSPSTMSVWYREMGLHTGAGQANANFPDPGTGRASPRAARTQPANSKKRHPGGKSK